MEQIVQVCYTTIIICVSQMQLNFMNVSILIFSHLKIIFRDIHIMLMLWSELKLLRSAGREKLCRSCKYKKIHLIMLLYIKIKQTSAIFVFFNLFFIYCIRLLELDYNDWTSRTSLMGVKLIF